MRTLPFFFLLWVSCSGEKTSKTQADAGGKEYANQVAALRKDKDNAFVTDPGSPFADLMEDFYFRIVGYNKLFNFVLFLIVIKVVI